MSFLPIRPIARRIYRALPESARGRIDLARLDRSLADRSSGIVQDPSIALWVARHRRPVSIVIPSYNDFPLLTACLEAIRSTAAAFEYEVIVVDDYCQPANSALLRTLESSRVRVIFKKERQGFAVAVNVGMAAAKHDIVLLNSDTVAQAGWLEALQYGAYAVDEKIGLVSPKLVYPDGRIQYGGTYYARVLAPQWFGHLYVGSAANRPLANVASYNRSISGACVYITRDAYEQLGGLDETYWLGFEDVDYGIQAWTRGIRCLYQPAAMVVHHESASRGYSQGARELGSMRHFWRKWSHLFLERTLPSDDLHVDFVLSKASSPLWRNYVSHQASELQRLGVATSVRMTDSTAIDESIVKELAPRKSVKIACDWGSADTVWLASLEDGKPSYLLPTVESGAFPHDPEKQSSIVSKYRPEFDYIAPNRWTADQLRAESAWETSHRVVPALPPKPLTADAPERIIVSVNNSKAVVVELRHCAESLGLILLIEDGDLAYADIERLSEVRPLAVIALSAYENSLEPLSLMALGGAFVGLLNDKTKFEVLDGYNALLVGGDAVESGALGKVIEDIATIDSVASELRINGHSTAERFARIAGSELLSALGTIARVSV
jgi:GT2 family glycosyltransferase